MGNPVCVCVLVVLAIVGSAAVSEDEQMEEYLSSLQSLGWSHEHLSKIRRSILFSRAQARTVSNTTHIVTSVPPADTVVNTSSVVSDSVPSTTYTPLLASTVDTPTVTDHLQNFLTVTDSTSISPVQSPENDYIAQGGHNRALVGSSVPKEAKVSTGGGFDDTMVGTTEHINFTSVPISIGKDVALPDDSEISSVSSLSLFLSQLLWLLVGFLAGVVLTGILTKFSEY